MKSTHIKTDNFQSLTAFWFNVEMEGYDDEYAVVFRPESNPHLINSAAEILTPSAIKLLNEHDETHKMILSQLISQAEKITK